MDRIGGLISYSQTMSTSSSNVKYRVSMNINGQNIAENYTSATVSVEAWRTNTGYTTYGTGSCSCTINGVNHSSAINAGQKITYNSFTVLGSWTVHIPHNSDGGKTLSVSASFNISGAVSSNAQSCDFQLPTIPRMSAPTLSKTNFNIGESVVFYPNLNSSSFTYNVSLQIGLLSRRLFTGMNHSALTIDTNIIADSLYSMMPHLQSAVGEFAIEVYNGGTHIGNSGIKFICNAHNSSPEINKFEVIDTNEKIKTLTGNNVILVHGESTAKCTLGYSTKNYATLSSMSIANGTTVHNSTPCTFTPQSHIFIAHITDSRNLTVSRAYTSPYIPYFTPSFKVVNLERQTTTSDILKLHIVGTYFDGNFGIVQNLPSVQWRWKGENSVSWSNWESINISVNGNDFSYHSDNFRDGFGFENSYVAEFKLSDKIHEYITTIQIPYGQPIVDIGKNDVKVNGKLYAKGFGDGKTTIHPEQNNQINFGGTDHSPTVFFGVHSYDGKPTPQSYVFGSGGSADLYINTLFSNNAVSTSGIEIFNETPYIDFHFQRGGADNTSRIIELSPGRLAVYNSISNASDRRLKKNISDLPDDYLNVLLELRPQTYRYIKGDEHLNIGFIAQEVQDSFKENGFDDVPLVSQENVNGGKYSLDYGGITALNTMGIQYLMKKFEGRCRQIEHLEKKIKLLELKLDEINE